MSMTDEAKVTIGRDTGCDITFAVEADDVSRLHAEASWSNELECVVVRDLGSANGTLPSEGVMEAADGSIRLTPGQTVILGEHTLGYAEIKRALDEKARTWEAERAHAAIVTKRARRRRRVVRALMGLLILGVVAAGAWFMVESTRTAEEAAATAREAASLAEQSRKAREEADELIAEREIEVDPDASMIGPFIEHENGTVSDTRTGLMWRRCSLGRTWQESRCVGETGLYAWGRAQPALELVNQEGGLSGHADWRLPTLVELLTLVQEGQGVLHAEAFPGVAPGHHWTSTAWSERQQRYWNVQMRDGIGYWDEAGVQRFVLPVRVIPAPES